MDNSIVLKEIEEIIKQNHIVLFMKGAKNAPVCGFSAAVVSILKHLEVDFLDVNVLANEEMRAGIKEYSDWPTIPQLYIKGKFIGGSDIAQELFRSGELKTLLQRS